MLNLDFSSVPSREPLDEGVYTLTVAKAEEKASQSGNPMMVVEFDVDGHEGHKLWDNFVLIDKCLWKTKEFFDALGLDTSSIVEMDVSELAGYSVQAKIIQEPYNEEITNRVKKYFAPKG